MNKLDKEDIKTTFFMGLLTLLPIAIIVVFFIWLFGLLVGIISPILGLIGLNYNLFLFFVVLIVLFLLIFLTGLMVRTKGGNYAFLQFEKLLLKLIPGYKQIKGVIDSFTGKGSSKNYKSVVLVDLYQNGCLMTGFVTDRPTKNISTVFVPTGPNPTNGMIYHVNNDFVIPVDVSTKKAFESIIAIGKNSKVVFDGVKLHKVVSSRKTSKKK